MTSCSQCAVHEYFTYLFTYLRTKFRVLLFVTTLQVSVVVVISESSAYIMKQPQNVLVLPDENAILNCSTNSTTPQGSNTTEWTYDGDIRVHRRCVSGGNPAFRVSSPDPRTDCNLIALPGEYGSISGPYQCRDGTNDPKAVAMIIVLGKLTF